MLLQFHLTNTQFSHFGMSESNKVRRVQIQHDREQGVFSELTEPDFSKRKERIVGVNPANPQDYTSIPSTKEDQQEATQQYDKGRKGLRLWG